MLLRSAISASIAPHARRGGRAGLFGFTLLEVLIVTGIIAVATAIVVPSLAKVRRARYTSACLSNLHQIGVAFQYYAQDNISLLPTPTDAIEWEDLLRPYVPRHLFACPADNELFFRLGSSYDWRDTGDPQTSLVGVNLAAVNRADVVLAFDALPGWHGPKKTNIVMLNGSAQCLDSQVFLQDLDRPVVPNPIQW